MRIYVSTGSPSYPLAREIGRLIRVQGHEWSYDWTIHMPGTPGRPDTPPEVISAAEREAIVTSHVLLCVLPGFNGTHYELGLADGAGIPTLLCGPRSTVYHDGDHPSDCLCPFYFLPHISRQVWPDRAHAETDTVVAKRVVMALDAFLRVDYNAISTRIAASRA